MIEIICPVCRLPQYLQDGPLPERMLCINKGTIRSEAYQVLPACQAIIEPANMSSGVRENVSLFYANGGLCIL